MKRFSIQPGSMVDAGMNVWRMIDEKSLGMRNINRCIKLLWGFYLSVKFGLIELGLQIVFNFNFYKRIYKCNYSDKRFLVDDSVGDMFCLKFFTGSFETQVSVGTEREKCLKNFRDRLFLVKYPQKKDIY